MSIYYLLLLCERFHDYPHLAGALFGVGFLSVTPTKLIGMAAVMAALVMPAPPNGVRCKPLALAVLFAALAAWSMLGTLLFGLPLPASGLSYLVSLGLLLIATRKLVSTPGRLENTLRVIVSASALATAWCYKQYFLEGAMRAWGVGLDPNYEALSLIIMIPLAVWMGWTESRWQWRALGKGAALSLTAATLLTQSRGGLLALAAVGCVALLRARGRPVGRLMLLAAAGAFVALSPASLWRRYESISVSGVAVNGDESSVGARLEVLVAGLHMIERHPLLGVGLDRFKALSADYNPALRASEMNFVAHDTYVQVAAEAGLPALAVFIAIMIAGFANCRAAVRGASDPALAGIAAAMRLALLAYAVAALFLSAEFLVWYWMLVFLSWNLREMADAGMRVDPAKNAEPPPRPANPIAVRYA